MTNRKLRLISLFFLAGLSGCVSYGPYGPYPYGVPGTQPPVPPPPPVHQPPTQPIQIPEQVARVLDVDGNFASIEREGRPVPVTPGQPIFTGDHFQTGPGTKLNIALDAGGTIQLDQNVDPTFFKTVKCVVLDFFKGRLAVDASGACVESGKSRVYLNSYVLFEAGANESLRVTVVRGRAETITPVGIIINEGETLVLQRGRAIGSPRRLSQQEINRLLSWVPVKVL